MAAFKQRVCYETGKSLAERPIANLIVVLQEIDERGWRR